MRNEAMTVKKMLPNLPLSIEQRLEGLTRILEKKSTRLGRELSDYLERRQINKCAREQAQAVLDEEWLVNTAKDGSLTTGMEEGYGRVSTKEQTTENQRIEIEHTHKLDFWFADQGVSGSAW